MATDGDLVRQTLAGETAAYGRLAQRWAARVLAVCHARVGRSCAEDLAQESLLRGLKALATLADADKFGHWLMGIAVRTCLDWLKSAQRTEVSLETVSIGETGATGNFKISSLASRPSDSHQGTTDRRERAEWLLREVEQLPPVYREVLMLYYYQDCTYQQLADTLGVSAATINARLTKARATLRSRMMTQQE